MNEKIKQLAKQAGYYLYDLTETHQIKTVETDNPDEWETLEKFAELIINECASLTLNPMQIDGAQYYHGWLDYRDHIRNHFNPDNNDIEYCPKCNAEWSGTSCGLNDCGWIGEEQ